MNESIIVNIVLEHFEIGQDLVAPFVKYLYFQFIWNSILARIGDFDTV